MRFSYALLIMLGACSMSPEAVYQQDLKCSASLEAAAVAIRVTGSQSSTFEESHKAMRAIFLNELTTSRRAVGKSEAEMYAERKQAVLDIGRSLLGPDGEGSEQALSDLIEQTTECIESVCSEEESRCRASS